MAEGSLSFEELESVATQPASTTPAELPAPTPTAAPVAEETKPQFTEADVEAYKQLVEMGITPQNAAEFKQAKSAMDGLPNLMKSPEGLRILFDEIQKNDPGAYKSILEYGSDRWFKELPESQRNGTNSASSTVQSSPELEFKLASMEAKLEQFITKQNQEESVKRQEAMATGYQKSVDTLIGKLPETVSERDRDYIRLKANELIWKDSAARDRVAKGVYVDVPTYFAKASRLVTAETKAAASAEHERRATVVANASREIPSAAENVNGSVAKKEGHGHDPIWGDISPTEVKSAYQR